MDALALFGLVAVTNGSAQAAQSPLRSSGGGAVQKSNNEDRA